MTTAEKTRRSIRGRIRNGMELTAISRQRLADKTGIPYSTLCRKIQDPLTLTVGEVIKIERAIGLRIMEGGERG